MLLRHSQAITLTELLVATVIVGIIMMGIISTDYAVRKHSQGYANEAQLHLDTRATLAHIRNNAVAAEGTGQALGVRISSMANDNTNYFCFQRNLADPLAAPPNYKWFCYTRTGTKIRFCGNKDSAGSCSSSDGIIGTVVSDGNGFSVSNPSFNANTFAITITNRTNPATDKSDTNPQVSLTLSVSPPAHAM
jgi:hypothetical protein